MRFLRGFGRFWYNFLIGDDWTIAAAVVAGLALTYWLRQSNLRAWWLMPIVALTALAGSVWRSPEARRATTRRTEER